MSQPAIEIEALSKRYSISHQRASTHRTLRDELAHLARRTVGRGGSAARAGVEDFWALRDVSFTVQPGDVVGIIGRNGSGKSTLLKILSRIVDPTAGRAVMRGKVASLLEVGTGFHPELTGRENIYFNGSILGMTKRRIDAEFDGIVAFAETERFLDTPVKFYSSGMYVRLAFAVAAHLDPDILIVDEVLAVGDAQFQKKCLGRMSQVANEGKTVLFVSHNMHAIQQLCSRAVYLESGMVHSVGRTQEVMHDYTYGQDGPVGAAAWRNVAGQHSDPHFTPDALMLLDSAGAVVDRPVRGDETVTVEITGLVAEPDPELTIGYALYSEDGEALFWSYPTDQARAAWPRMGPGPVTLRCDLPLHLLKEGEYRVELIGGIHFRSWILQPNVDAPSVAFTLAGGLSDSPFFQGNRPTLLALVLRWECR